MKFGLENAKQTGKNNGMTLAQIAREVEGLSELEKTQLARMIGEQLHGPVDPAMERAQIDFAEERLKAYARGEDTAEDTDVVLERLRRKLMSTKS